VIRGFWSGDPRILIPDVTAGCLLDTSVTKGVDSDGDTDPRLTPSSGTLPSGSVTEH